jgi:hypothetical protein
MQGIDTYKKVSALMSTLKNIGLATPGYAKLYVVA